MYEKKIFCTVLVECLMKKFIKGAKFGKGSIKDLFLFLGWVQSLCKSELMLEALAERLLFKRRTASPITRLEEFCYTLVRPKNTFESEATEGGKLHLLKP